MVILNLLIELYYVKMVSKDIIESALRDFICKDSPELAEGWILSPKYNIADVVFSATKD